MISYRHHTLFFEKTQQKSRFLRESTQQKSPAFMTGLFRSVLFAKGLERDLKKVDIVRMLLACSDDNDNV